jgi:hypothetical protein
MKKIIFIMMILTGSCLFAEYTPGYSTAASILLTDTNSVTNERIVYCGDFAYPFTLTGLNMFMNDFTPTGEIDEIAFLNPLYEEIIGKEKKSSFTRSLTTPVSFLLASGGAYYMINGDSSDQENAGKAACIVGVALYLAGSIVAKKQAPSRNDFYGFYNSYNSLNNDRKALIK